MTTHRSHRGSHHTEEESLRHKLHEHLIALGFSKNCRGYFIGSRLTKDKIRSLHSPHRQQTIEKNKAFIEEYGAELLEHFASGKDIRPTAIDPEIVEVFPGSVDSRLFRYASLLWSIPVSQGFGRRLRFLVRDRHNDRLIGLFALGDPVFNLSARDEWIGWSHQDRAKRLRHVMDAYVVGAVPPYSQLIGGKMIASLMASTEVIEAYTRKYSGQTTLIGNRNRCAALVLLTTTSALGRSSLYNRLALPTGHKFLHIGTTKGFGHFHLSGSIFESLRAYLQSTDHPYASGHSYGMGPNWRLRVIRAALEQLGVDGDSVMRHGIGREVYALPIADNWKGVLLGRESAVAFRGLTVADIATYCLRRWIVPRARRDQRYRNFDKSTIVESLRSTILRTAP